MVSTPKFWHGRKVFVTGHTGFKGAWLCLWLHAIGAKVQGYALPPPTTPSLYELAGLGRCIDAVEADVRDLARLQSAVASAAPEIVFHLAAQSLVRPSYEDPVGTFQTNVMGTVNILEAARLCASVRAVVIVTSDKCYENREWLWGYREFEPMGGYDPYSSSKGCAELVTAAYRRSFLAGPAAAGVGSARAGNVIGGGDWAQDRLVPDILAGFAARRPVPLRNPGAVRPWQHVLEPLSGYLLLAERLYQEPGRFSDAWNFGPTDEDARSVAWIAERLREHWGADAPSCLHDGAQGPHEASFLKLDCSKARSVLGWTPRLSVQLALDWTVQWHRAYLSGEDMQRFTQAQIEGYQRQAVR